MKQPAANASDRVNAPFTPFGEVPPREVRGLSRDTATIGVLSTSGTTAKADNRIDVAFTSPTARDNLSPLVRNPTMSTEQPPPPAKPFWRRGLAGFLDFITVFFGGGYAVGAATGQTTKDGFSLTGAPALLLFALIVLYFYLGWKVLGSTLWQRVLGAR